MAEDKTENKKVDYSLEMGQELRFEADSESTVSLELTSGKAEVFGSEMAKNKVYKFLPGTNGAVYTWHKCNVTLTGKTEAVYVAKETPMTMYINTHAALEQMRQKASEEDARGPRVMVVGPTDVGKSTTCKLLLNYAARMNRAPIFVDLDVGQGELSIPGTLGALVVEKPADVEEGFSMSAPLIYHYGHVTPGENMKLYSLLITKLSTAINMRCQHNKKANVSGVIINSCGWIRGGGYHALVHAAGAFEVDVILVLDQERLYSQLQGDMPEFVKVVLLPKSGGVVERSQNFRTTSRNARIHEYFYGLRTKMYPHTFDVKFADIKIYKIGAPDLPESMLPLGVSAEESRTKPMLVPPSPLLIHRVLSISTAITADEDIVTTNVAGFIVVMAINTELQCFTVLSPSPAPLPRSILLLMQDVQFMDIS